MVRGILFDLDGTLFDRDAAVRDLVADQHRRLSASFPGTRAETYVARVLDLDAHGHGDKTVVYRQVAAEFGLPAPLASALTADFWDKYHSFCRPIAGAVPVLTELRHRGLKLGVITNGAIQIQEPVIVRLGFAALVDVVLISEREGVRKPDREIFDRALRKLDVRADETWYVGDHPEFDVEGAAAAGLTPIWKRTLYWSPPDARHKRIESLEELLPLVRENL
jgi:putative hydrolase of the HAD superfamily